jgi:hypothetical protein
VNQSGLSTGTYNGIVRIAIADRNGAYQTASVAVSLLVSSGGATTTPSILLNPTSLSFPGTAGGANPLAKTMNLANPAGGTLTWSMRSLPPGWHSISLQARPQLKPIR